MKLLSLLMLPFLLFAETAVVTVTEAKAEIHPSSGSQVKGVVTFKKVSNGVLIVADLEGLAPGKHGFHIHEKGDCSAADASSAGGHFNPDNQPHGGPDSEKRHVGDLGNIKADDKGKAHYERVDTIVKLNGDHSIVGRSVVVHADPDDYVTQPSGNAGNRIGCGVIQAVK